MTRKAKAIDPTALFHRLQATGLTRWEVADLLGIHPHELEEGQLKNLRELPVRLLVELARRLDMHPADLVDELDTVLTNPRALPADPLAPTGPPQPDPGVHADAMTVLSALAHAPYPITATELARTLTFTVTRVHAALDHLTAHPELGGPMALRHIPPQTYTLTPRVDILNAHQQSMLLRPRLPRAILAVQQADALYAFAYASLQEYDAYRDEHPHAEEYLLRAGLILESPDGELHLHDDVLFGLKYLEQNTDDYQEPWWSVDTPPTHPDEHPPPQTPHRRAMRRRDSETMDLRARDDYYGQHPRRPGRRR